MSKLTNEMRTVSDIVIAVVEMLEEEEDLTAWQLREVGAGVSAATYRMLNPDNEEENEA